LIHLAILGKLKSAKEPIAMTTHVAKSKKKKDLWPPIHKLTYTSGKVGWQVACMVNGRRIREAFSTKGAGRSNPCATAARGRRRV
jgi:hypothetical protein